jgi:hypothetical protein
MGNLNQFQERYIALRQCLIIDGRNNGVSIHENDLRTISERIQNEGTSFAKVTLPLLGKALDRGLVSGQFSCPAQFSLKRDSRLPRLLYACFSRIFEDSGALRAVVHTGTLTFLRQFLLLDAKLRMEPTPGMQKEAVDGFANRMAALRKKRIQVDHPVLVEAKELLGRCLAGLNLSDINPGHGPGAVAERLDRFGRWDFKMWPKKAESCYPYSMYGVHALEAIMAKGCGIPLSKETSTRCCLVPKDFKGPRLISAEATVNQYLQQGQMKAIMAYVERHPLMKLSIKLRDQTRNQKMARQAYERDQATLDLSDASDTVSVALVWFLLSGVPRLRKQLMSTRSDFMIWKDRKIKITAFAPMGSATCFPVETLVFWAISMASVRLTRFHPNRHEAVSSYRVISRDVAVFGDDIIVPREALPTLVGTLSSVGCTPNMSKTCVDTPFRESCGTEWFGYDDITIIRNKKYQYETSALGDHPVLCDMQRKFFSRCYYSTAALLSEWAREIWPVPTVSLESVISNNCTRKGWEFYPGRRYTDNLVRVLPQADYFERDTFKLDRFPFLLGFYNEGCKGLKVRWNKNYQRLECRVPRPFRQTKDWVTGGYPRLLARLLGDQVERIAIRTDKVKMAWLYIPGLSVFQQKNLE